MTNVSVTPPVERSFVGIDVSKASLDAARSDRPGSWQVANDPPGIAGLVEQLRVLGPACIVVESTGGAERSLLAALLEASLPVALVNPGQVRHLAKGLGLLAKTDALDAQVLARFAQLAGPRLLEKRSDKQLELEALVTCRRQLVKTRTEQSNRLGLTTSPMARRALETVVATLDQQIAVLDKQIRAHIAADDQWKHLEELIRSAPGAGAVLATTLLASVPELGKLDHRALAALIGVAPFNRDSGRFKGQRTICGGRAAVRSVLYMATVVAMSRNPVIHAFAQRLLKAGKRWKVAAVACMHKFLILLNTMARENLTWDQLNVVKKA